VEGPNKPSQSHALNAKLTSALNTHLLIAKQWGHSQHDENLPPGIIVLLVIIAAIVLFAMVWFCCIRIAGPVGPGVRIASTNIQAQSHRQAHQARNRNTNINNLNPTIQIVFPDDVYCPRGGSPPPTNPDSWPVGPTYPPSASYPPTSYPSTYPWCPGGYVTNNQTFHQNRR
jgi:hypothetical protein